MLATLLALASLGQVPQFTITPGFVVEPSTPRPAAPKLPPVVPAPAFPRVSRPTIDPDGCTHPSPVVQRGVVTWPANYSYPVGSKRPAHRHEDGTACVRGQRKKDKWFNVDYLTGVP